MVSLVRWGVVSRPGIGGTKAREPVAITKRRALIVTCPARSVSGAVKAPQASMTRTPRLS